eukprot:1552031-Prorocentrum_lima.AAC.1
MRRKEQDSKPLAIRHQQLAEAIKKQQSQLVNENIEWLQMKDTTDKKQEATESTRNKIRELEEDMKQ